LIYGCLITDFSYLTLYIIAFQVNGNLFIVGGFSGRQFLSSLEILAEGSSEWSGHDQIVVGTDSQPVPTENDKEKSELSIPTAAPN